MTAPTLEVNTNTASAQRKKKFLITPKGARVESFSPADLAVFKRALRWQRKRAVENLLPGARVSKCYVVRIKPEVEIHYAPKVKRAHYAGLMICGRVWPCPICAAKITERRRIELQAADVRGLSYFMVTITLQHSAKDDLKTLSDDLGSAWRKVTAGRGWQRIKKMFKIVGSVTGREVTYGIKNGWHPHLHILYYSKMSLKKIRVSVIRDHISDRFQVAVKSLGRYASPIHAVQVTTGEDLTRLYIAKVGLEDDKENTWNLVSEITKAPAKMSMAEGDHYTPFQLVDLYMCGDRQAGKRFIEYANAMHRRKQLTYSKGLRLRLKIGQEMDDQEIAEAMDQEARLLATLTPDQWRKVLEKGKRGMILEVASSGDYKLFKAYCETLGITDMPESMM